MSRNGFRSAFQFLCWEAAFAMAYETWIGPCYISGIAGELGVQVGLVGLLTAVPWIGSAGQLFGAWAYERVPSIKNYVLTLAIVSRLLWTIPVFFAWLWGWQAHLHGAEFPAQRWFELTAIVACISALVGVSSGAGWMAWTRDLIPDHLRGRFFGLKLRFTVGGIIVAHSLAYFVVGWKPGGLYLGYGTLLLCAMICAALSTFLLAKVPDCAPLPHANPRKPWLETIREPFQDEKFRRLLIYGAVFNGAVQLAGPYFPYYFTKELKLPMSTVSFWTLLTNLGWFAAAVAWGRCADRSRELGRGFRIASYMIALSPLFYIGTSVSWVRMIGPLDYFTNGIAWAGYNILFTTLLIKNCREGRTAIYYSVYQATAGLTGTVATLLGAELASLLQPWGGFRILWVISAALRVVVIAKGVGYLSGNSLGVPESKLPVTNWFFPVLTKTSQRLGTYSFLKVSKNRASRTDEKSPGSRISR